MSKSTKNENESVLLLKAMILDINIENPEQVVIANGEKAVLLSEIFTLIPGMREKMINERDDIFRQLGWS